MPKLVISSNTAWSLFNFRAGLIRALVSEGYEVIAVAPSDEYAPRLESLGCRYVPLPMDNKGTHPGKDFLLLCRFWLLLIKERPAVYLGYTVKPNVYGSIAAHFLGIPVINNIAGLGVVFISDSFLTKVVKALYRIALLRSYRIFFQNEEDRELFLQAGLVRKEKTDRLPGSGVDLANYVPKQKPIGGEQAAGRQFRFLLAARMLWDKGVGVYVEAARQVKKKYPHVEFCLLGFLDVKNPTAITREQMSKWSDEGVIQYLGVTDDMKSVLADTDCIVLPSYYREGVPRTLLEAAAMSRPIITTDAVGCRDAVDDAVTGYLCTPRDVNDLAEKMMAMINLSSSERAEMGKRGREKMEREFDEKIVIDRYREVIKLAMG